MRFLESILYALVSGLTEILPVSSFAHRAILLRLFGADGEMPILGFSVHAGILLGLFFETRNLLRRLQKEHQLSLIPKRRRRRHPDIQSVMDISLIKTACIPLLLAFLLYPRTLQWRGQLHLVALFLIMNGLILHFPVYLPQGNKDSRSVTKLDALLFGAGSALSMLPGISRIGAFSSVAVARGVDTQQALKWSLLFSYPALLGYICFDIYGLFASGFAGVGFLVFLQGIVCTAAAFVGARLAIILVRFISVRAGLFGFSYYSWGAALFAFILYMTI
ncbi:MAG: undecaprenyl-diphosphate phosphatase [Oscillospiraceae bacterium]|nr:undecaprenyl-diphosphate phosphatase [Oscillospiraceae bacterium]